MYSSRYSAPLRLCGFHNLALASSNAKGALKSSRMRMRLLLLAALVGASVPLAVLLMASDVVDTVALKVLSGYCGKVISALSPLRIFADISCGTWMFCARNSRSDE